MTPDDADRSLRPTIDWAVAGRPNAFRDRYGSLSDEEWLDVLARSVSEPQQDGIAFPTFPSPELQQQIHGSADEAALREGIEFYSFVKQRSYLAAKMAPECGFLDFGSGWGRISRLFLRDFDLSQIYGFEPHLGLCFVARSLNPYICFLTGGFLPDNTLPPDRFDLIVGWSVFSHLSEFSAAAWLGEMARILRPTGYGVFSTWGARFLDRLADEQAQLAAGKEIHWYSKACIEQAGDIAAQQRKYANGDFVWFGEGPIEHYGNVCAMHPNALFRLITKHDLPLQIVEFDRKTLPQDVFILQRS
jgi:SAM-dependent methyltransferase